MERLFKEKGKQDFSDLNFKLNKNDKSILTEFGNTVDMYGGIVEYYTLLLEETSAQADTLILKLNKEYNIQSHSKGLQ